MTSTGRLRDVLHGRNRRAAAVCGVVALVAATALVVHLVADRGGPPWSTSSARPVEVTDLPALAALPVRPTVGGPASELLRALTARLAPAAGDGQTGSHEYVHVRQWALDSSYRNSSASNTVVSFEQQFWLAPDGAVRVVRLAPPPAATEDHPAGTRHGLIDGPLPTDPTVLAEACYRHQPRENRPASIPRALATLNRERFLPTAVRAAALQVLADLPELRYRGTVTDRAGRAGIAVAVDTDPFRDTLILDPATGDLLAYEQVLTGKPGGTGLTPPAVVDHQLYLDRGRRDPPTTNR